MENIFTKAIVYVNQAAGDDTQSGYEKSKPVKTLERAFDIIDDARRNQNAKHPMVIEIRGDYYAVDGIKISNDKMLNGITLASQKDTRARIIGGRKLENWKQDTFNGVDCLSCDADFAEGDGVFTDLYVNGKRAAMTRYPEHGKPLLEALDTEKNDSVCKGEKPGLYYQLFDGSKWFIAHKEDLNGLDNIEDGIISFYHYWIDEHTPVESYDRQTGKLTLKNRSCFKITTYYGEKTQSSDLYYYIENLPNYFKNMGEWYFDRHAKKVYYIPLDGQTADNIEVFAPSVSTVITVCGDVNDPVCNVRIKDIDIICSRGDYSVLKNINGEPLGEEVQRVASDPQAVSGGYGTVSFENAHYCSVDNCSVSCTGIHAVSIGEATRGIRIENTKMQELGGGGVRIFGAKYSEDTEIQKLYSESIVVSKCKISHCGLRHAAACGILANFAKGCEFSENEISYLDYTGISCGWCWGYDPNSGSYQNVIKNNHIHHVGMGRLSDMGGIYLLGMQPGTVVSGNVIHDVNSAHYGGWGLYTDEGSSYMVIEDNIVYRTKSNCFHQHYGSHNLVRNNIFAYAGETTLRLSREEEHMGVLFEDNVFITKGEPVYPSGSREKPIHINLISDNNIIWNVTGEDPVFMRCGEENILLDEWKTLSGRDENSVVRKPCEEIIKLVER